MIIDNQLTPRGLVLIALENPRADRRRIEQLDDRFVLSLTGTSSPTVWRPDITRGLTTSRATEGARAPLPSGQVATYHLRRMPRQMQAEVMVTDHPLLPSVRNVEPDLASLANRSERRSQALLSALQGWYSDRTILAAVTNTDIIQTGYISQFDVPRNPEQGSALLINLTIQEIETFANQRIDQVDDIANDLGASRIRAGGTTIG